MRIMTSAAGLVLLAGLLTGCGGGDGGSAPADASEEEFCEAFAGLFSKLGEMDPEDTESGVRAMKAWAADMEEVGTPKGIPDDARAGFERLLESVQRVDDDASQEELDALGQELGEGDNQKESEAFASYAIATCPDAMGGLMGDVEGEMGDLTESPGS